MCCPLRVGWDGGLETEGKPKQLPEALIMRLQSKASSGDEVSLQCAHRGGRAQPDSPLPRRRTRGRSQPDGRARSPRQPGLGTLVESRPEHQRAHQRAESSFSHGIASGSGTRCQFPNWLLLSPREYFFNFFFFLTTAIFMQGIICRTVWKDLDCHFLKFPVSESSSLFDFTSLRNAPWAPLGVEATLVN